MKKQKLLVSFSGGETSAYMAKWLIDNKSDKYEMAFVFANTGEENEETLNFVNRCDKEWNLGVVWVEANVHQDNGFATTFKIVDYKSASRKGEPFKDVIKKYGIPNQSFPHCNREMKLRPIHSYIKNGLNWSKGYQTAIGIRYDEVDRMVADRSTYNIVYPLIEGIRMTKQKINHWWSKQPFRLNLKGYQGNCKTCWKKSYRNLYAISKENPEHFDFFKQMENEFSLFTALNRKKQVDEHGNLKPFHFFRGDKSVDDILNEAKLFNGKVRDSHNQTSYQIDLFDMIDDVESCDIYSGCGDLS